MSYLRYLCLVTHSGVQHILRGVFVLFVFVSCTLCWQFLRYVHLWLPLRYFLAFIVTVKHIVSQKNAISPMGFPLT